MKKLNLKNVKTFSHKNGKIIVFQKSKDIQFKFKRVFVVKSNKNNIRGKHAHKKCIPLLNCPTGSVEIVCERQNKSKKKFLLNNPKKYLIVPPMVWCTQNYKMNNSILMVICNQKFSEKDYIRNYKDFTKK